MVLEEFGQKISKAIREMQASTVLDQKVLDGLIKTLQMSLIQADVNIMLVKKLCDNVKKAITMDESQGQNKRKIIQSTIVQELYKLLDSGKARYEMKKNKCNVIMFVGLQGSGKTTTCTKFAYYWRKRGWKVALVCADTFRAGAFDQLKQNATKANIPFYGSYTERDPVVVAEQGVAQFREEKYEIIIVDTSGRHKQEEALFEEMQEVNRVVQPDDIVFTMDGSIGQAAKAQAVAFKKAVNVGSVIVTKLDGNAKGGGALSAVAATKSPIIFIGTGEHIDAFEVFDAEGFVQSLMGMGNIRKLLELMSEKKFLENPSEMYKKLLQGKCDFTFRDMYEQFQALMSLGPLSEVMKMIPGLSNLMNQPGQEGKQENQIKKFMCIMDSMNNFELDSDNTLMNKEPKRIQRIARGSGCHPVHVESVLATLKPFKSIAEQLKKITGGKMDGQLKPGREGQKQMEQMAKLMPPGVLQQMGGMQGFQQMMKSMSPDGMGGGMDPAMMQKMMAQMGGAMGGAKGGGRRGGRR